MKLKVNNIKKSYGNIQALKNINFELESGNIIGFVGKNGAGKTTLEKIIMGIISSDDGTIELDNQQLSNKVIKSYIGYMPSEAIFYNDIKVIDIFKLSSSVDGIELDNYLELAEYFELDIKLKCNQLSLGNKKKVSMVNALATNRNILILDEPTNGLDPIIKDKFFKVLKHYRKKDKLIFLSSHNLYDIQELCDRVIVINEGEIIKDIDMKEYCSDEYVVEYYNLKNQKIKYIYKGNINELLKELQNENLKNLVIIPNLINKDMIEDNYE